MDTKFFTDIELKIMLEAVTSFKECDLDSYEILKESRSPLRKFTKRQVKETYNNLIKKLKKLHDRE